MTSKEYLKEVEGVSNVTVYTDGNKTYYIDDLARVMEEYHQYKLKLSGIDTTRKDEQSKNKVKMTLDGYTDKFYLSNGFTYESKKTGKLVDVGELIERYTWHTRYL